MSFDKKTDSAIYRNVSGAFAGKTVSTIEVYRHGSTEVCEVVFTSGPSFFLKFRQNLVETGGTADWGTGTAL